MCFKIEAAPKVYLCFLPNTRHLQGDFLGHVHLGRHFFLSTKQQPLFTWKKYQRHCWIREWELRIGGVFLHLAGNNIHILHQTILACLVLKSGEAVEIHETPWRDCDIALVMSLFVLKQARFHWMEYCSPRKWGLTLLLGLHICFWGRALRYSTRKGVICRFAWPF